jgi:metal-dependent HD superfamily phosphatase/phosphodiesterase
MTVNNALETTTVINNIYNDVEPATFVNEKVVTELLNELREQIAQEIENAVIEVAGNSDATMQQAARIVRGLK